MTNKTIYVLNTREVLYGHNIRLKDGLVRGLQDKNGVCKSTLLLICGMMRAA